jgi:TusA-related sulfurtransferase
MAIETLDTTNLHRASAILKIAAKVVTMQKGDILEVIGSSFTFTDDVQKWCERSNKECTFYLDTEHNAVKCHIKI